MATESFITDLTFDEKSANNLIQALSSRSKAKRHVPTKVEMIKVQMSLKICLRRNRKHDNCACFLVLSKSISLTRIEIRVIIKL